MPTPNDPKDRDEIQEITPEATEAEQPKAKKDTVENVSAISQVMDLISENKHRGSERQSKGPMVFVILAVILILAGIGVFYYFTFVSPIAEEKFIIM